MHLFISQAINCNEKEDRLAEEVVQVFTACFLKTVSQSHLEKNEENKEKDILGSVWFCHPLPPYAA